MWQILLAYMVSTVSNDNWSAEVLEGHIKVYIVKKSRIYRLLQHNSRECNTTETWVTSSKFQDEHDPHNGRAHLQIFRHGLVKSN